MTTKEQIIKILTEYPETRDSDPALFRAVIDATHCVYAHSYSEITKLQEQRKLPSHESMRRCRQKIQAENPFLRGKLHERRKELCDTVIPLVNSDFNQATLLF